MIPTVDNEVIITDRPFLFTRWLVLDIFDILTLKSLNNNTEIGVKSSAWIYYIYNHTTAYYCNIKVHIPNRKPRGSLINDLSGWLKKAFTYSSIKKCQR